MDWAEAQREDQMLIAVLDWLKAQKKTDLKVLLVEHASSEEDQMILWNQGISWSGHLAETVQAYNATCSTMTRYSPH